jgi:hypothetical protein
MPGWQLLASGEGGISVSRCPEGHIHLEVNAGLVTIRLDKPQFIAFAHTVMQALEAVSSTDLGRPFELQRWNRSSQN